MLTKFILGNRSILLLLMNHLRWTVAHVLLLLTLYMHFIHHVCLLIILTVQLRSLVVVHLFVRLIIVILLSCLLLLLPLSLLFNNSLSPLFILLPFFFFNFFHFKVFLHFLDNVSFPITFIVNSCTFIEERFLVVRVEHFFK